MKRDLRALLSDIKTGHGPQLLLLFGDDLRVEETCKSVLDQLVPAEQRGFNFERFDGRTASWEQIEGSLMTPPFFPGKKLLWVENAPYFFSKEQKTELGDKALEFWRAGKQDAAAKLLLDLLMVQGWTQERWQQMEISPRKTFFELFGSEGRESAEDIGALLAYCRSRDFDLSRRRGSEDHRLQDVLERGLPEWSFLLLTAVQVDRRTRIYKRLEELGAVVYLGLERDRSGKVSRESLLDFVGERLRRAGKTLDHQAREMILIRAGDDLRSLQHEIDKLLLLVGDRAVIRIDDVRAIVVDRGEGWIFDLTRAMGDRNAAGALAELARLVGQGEPPLKILATIASEIRRLLVARQLLATDLRKLWKRGMTYQQFQQNVLGPGAPVITRNPYADYMCFQRAERFSLAELHSQMEAVFAADYRLKSGGNQPQLVLERLILQICVGTKKPAGSYREQVAG